MNLALAEFFFRTAFDLFRRRIDEILDIFIFGSNNMDVDQFRRKKLLIQIKQ